MDFNQLTEYIDSLREEYGIHAADCKITKDHQTVYRHMAGYADYEEKVPLSEKNLFRLFSATKLITMTAVLQLIERGKLSFYDEVSKYLPEYDRLLVADSFEMNFPMVWPTREDKCHLSHNSIRIIDLMSMTAGLSYDTDSKEIMDIKKASGNRASTREVAAQIARMPLIYEPRTRWGYSLAHDVLAAVVEVVSGMRFFDYLNKNIFAPLEVKDFYFSWDGALSDRVCALYMGVFGTDDIVPDDGIRSGSFKLTDSYESGGAGLVSTVNAYSVFIDALSSGGVSTNGERILNEETVNLFTREYTQGQMRKDFQMTGKTEYGYGLGVRVLTDKEASKSPLGEFGWDGAAGAYALVDTVNHISIFYAQHVMGFPRVYSEIHPRIRDLAYEAMGF